MARSAVPTPPRQRARLVRALAALPLGPRPRTAHVPGLPRPRRCRVTTSPGRSARSRSAGTGCRCRRRRPGSSSSGLTKGLPFTENPCLASQVGWVRTHGRPAQAYTMAAFPTAAQLTTYRAEGPWSARTRAGQLSNVGYAEATYAVASLRGPASRRRWSGSTSNRGPAQPWPTGTAAQQRENRYVIEGLMRGLRDAGFSYGVYSYASGWQAITGSWWLPGVPVWATAGPPRLPDRGARPVPPAQLLRRAGVPVAVVRRHPGLRPDLRPLRLHGPAGAGVDAVQRRRPTSTVTGRTTCWPGSPPRPSCGCTPGPAAAALPAGVRIGTGWRGYRRPRDAGRPQRRRPARRPRPGAGHRLPVALPRQRQRRLAPPGCGSAAGGTSSTPSSAPATSPATSASTSWPGSGPPAPSGSTPATAAAAGCRASGSAPAGTSSTPSSAPATSTATGRADLLARERSTGVPLALPRQRPRRLARPRPGRHRLERHDRRRERPGTSPATACPTCWPATGPATCGSTRATAHRHVAAARVRLGAGWNTVERPLLTTANRGGTRRSPAHPRGVCRAPGRTGRRIRRRPAPWRPGPRRRRPSASRPSGSAITAARLSLPRGSISLSSTWIFWPILTTSSTLSIRLPPTSLRTSEMCSRPSLPGRSETNAPKVVVLTTVPRKRSPTSGICGFAMALIIARAASADGPSVAPM